MINKKIIFIGPSFVGKSTISSIVANKLNLKRLNFDSLLKYHTIYESEGDELNIANLIIENIKETTEIVVSDKDLNI